MDPLWSETCWSTLKYFIISIISTNYIFVHLLDNKVFNCHLCSLQTWRSSGFTSLHKIILTRAVQYRYFIFKALVCTPFVMWSVGWDSLVSIATCYGTGWSGDRIPEGVDLLNASGPVVHAVSYRMGTAEGTWRWSFAPSTTGVEDRVELFLYFRSEPLRPFLGHNFTF